MHTRRTPSMRSGNRRTDIGAAGRCSTLAGQGRRPTVTGNTCTTENGNKGAHRSSIYDDGTYRSNGSVPHERCCCTDYSYRRGVLAPIIPSPQFRPYRSRPAVSRPQRMYTDPTGGPYR